jgi:hypothetical protein
MSLRFKIYDPAGDLTATTRYASDAAAMAAILGAGTRVRFASGRGYTTAWREGNDASDSYDAAAALMWERIREASRAATR